MSIGLCIALAVVSAILLIPMLIVSFQCLAAVVLGRGESRERCHPHERGSVAVLIPAHNEEVGILATLSTIRPQLRGDDRIVVVADNCTDATAEAARQAGAIVVERQDSDKRGKGYALDAGLCFLESAPPDVVVMFDADCCVNDGAIDALARTVMATGRPAQAVNLLDPPPNPSTGNRVSAFAFCVKNLVRPLGMRAVGAPCLLSMGNAFPWPLIRNAPLASGNIVEDMQLGLDLAVAGHPPILCTAARVNGQLPSNNSARISQRTRWEHGHLRTILSRAPGLLGIGVAGGRFDLIALALDLCVPPLSLLMVLAIAMMCLNIGTYLVCGWLLPLAVMAGGWMVFSLSLSAAWWKFGRALLPATALLWAPTYVLHKLPIYFSFIRRPQQAWIRTERE